LDVPVEARNGYTLEATEGGGQSNARVGETINGCARRKILLVASFRQ
jgi:hypothetical protein